MLRRLRRASLAALRREVEPAEQAALGRFLPSWHGIDRRATLREALVPLQGLPLPVSLWESEVLPRRVPGYQPAQLDELCAPGEVVWVGAGLDRVALYFREDAPVLGRVAGAPSRRRARRPTRSARALRGGAPSSGSTCSRRAGLEAEEALPALWELVWAGEVTNDAWTPLRAGRRYGIPQAASGGRAASRAGAPTAVTATQGRWSLTDRLFPGQPDRRALAELLLERQGIVTRDGVRARGDRRRLRRRLRRAARRSRRSGSAAAATSSRGSAARSSRSPARSSGCASCGRARTTRPEPLVLAAADPAQPYGAALPWPKRAGARAARVAGAHVVLLGGEAALFVERGGRSLVPLREPEDEWLRPALAALVAHVRAGGAKRLAVERFDGEPVAESPALAAARRGRLPRRPAPRGPAPLVPGFIKRPASRQRGRGGEERTAPR